VPCTGFGFTLASIKAEFQQRTCVGEALNDAVHETLQNNATEYYLITVTQPKTNY